MKYKVLTAALLLGGSILLPSCTDTFSDINSDPARSLMLMSGIYLLNVKHLSSQEITLHGMVVSWTYQHGHKQQFHLLEIQVLQTVLTLKLTDVDML